MFSIKKIIFVFCLGFVFVSCGVKGDLLGNIEQKPLKLSLIKIKHQGSDYLANDGAYIELGKDDVIGSSGCNRFFGKASYDNDSVVFGSLGVTKMYCYGYGFEDKFFQSLTKLKIIQKSKSIVLYNDEFEITAKLIK